MALVQAVTKIPEKLLSFSQIHVKVIRKKQLFQMTYINMIIFIETVMVMKADMIVIKQIYANLPLIRLCIRLTIL